MMKNKRKKSPLPYLQTWEEAVKRMARRNTTSVCWTLADKTIEYKYIQATSAKNYDGSSAGSRQANHIILQQMVWRDGEQPRFSNRW